MTWKERLVGLCLILCLLGGISYAMLPNEKGPSTGKEYQARSRIGFCTRAAFQLCIMMPNGLPLQRELLPCPGTSSLPTPCSFMVRINARHKQRCLLLSGDVEMNPGPGPGPDRENDPASPHPNTDVEQGATSAPGPQLMSTSDQSQQTSHPQQQPTSKVCNAPRDIYTYTHVQHTK